jgi:hypothetical protein
MEKAIALAATELEEVRKQPVVRATALLTVTVASPTSTQEQAQVPLDVSDFENMLYGGNTKGLEVQGEVVPVHEHRSGVGGSKAVIPPMDVNAFEQMLLQGASSNGGPVAEITATTPEDCSNSSEMANDSPMEDAAVVKNISAPLDVNTFEHILAANGEGSDTDHSNRRNSPHIVDNSDTPKAEREAARVAAEEAERKAARVAAEEAEREAARVAAEGIEREAARVAAEEAEREDARVAAEEAEREAARVAAEEAEREAACVAAEEAEREDARVAAEEAEREAARVAAEEAEREAACVAAEEAEREAARVAAEEAEREAARVAAEEAEREAARVAAEEAEREAARVAADKEVELGFGEELAVDVMGDEVAAGTGGTGVDMLKCSRCGHVLEKNVFSVSQRKKKSGAACKECIAAAGS